MAFAPSRGAGKYGVPDAASGAHDDEPGVSSRVMRSRRNCEPSLPPNMIIRRRIGSQMEAAPLRLMGPRLGLRSVHCWHAGGGASSNVASTDLLPSSVIDWGLVFPVRSPCHATNRQPDAGTAV